eukprot:CCRYP_013840-RA/>CCRYP_013840-RA protein AED:0.29 eAED:0.32 QI:0/0/0.5/1/0/0/2/147/59
MLAAFASKININEIAVVFLGKTRRQTSRQGQNKQWRSAGRNFVEKSLSGGCRIWNRVMS